MLPSKLRIFGGGRAQGARRSRVNRRHRRPAAEVLEDRHLLSITLGTEPEINAFAGVGFALNPVTQIVGVFNGVQVNNPGDYKVQIDWGDGSSGDSTAELVAVQDGVLVKASHVYSAAQSAPGYTVTVTVTGPDGEQATDATTIVAVDPMPDSASRPPDLPTKYDGAQPLGVVSLVLGTEPEINAFAGVGFALNPVTDVNGVYNGSQDNTTSDYHAQINWGDGPQWDANVGLTALGTSGVLVKGSHIYQAQGNYHVTVYVTGPDGQTASATTTLVSVSPLPEAASRTPSVMVPIAYPGSEPLAAESLVLGTEPEINAFAGVGFALNPVTEITGEYNSSQDNTTSDYHAQINWGDSPQWDANVGLTALGTSGVLVKGSHIYQAQGNYSVTVYVTGPDGQTVSATTTLVSVAPLPDAASRPPHVPTTYTGAQALAAEELDLGTEPEINAFAGVGFALNPVTDITGQYNDSQDNTTSDYRAQINWGDGPNWDANVGLTALGTSGLLVKGSHIYQSQGNYHVTVYVTGPDGQTINATTTLVSVALLPDAASRPPDVPTPYSGAQPLATVGLDLSTEPEINATAGVAFAPSPVTEIDGTYNNSPDTTAGDYHAQINWGDGPQWDTNTTLTSTSSGVLVKGEHTYQDQGSYAVTLYVTGPDGQTESDTTTEVEVSPNPNAISLGILTPAQWTVNQPGYDGTIPVTGGTGGYQNLQVSGLPSGLKAAVSSSTVDGQLSGTITITGTPTQSGTFPLTTTLDDTEGDTGSGTETLTITPKQTPTIQIAINDTVSTNDNITLYIPPGSAQPYTQTVPARITNLGSDAATFQLMVTQAGSGNVTLSQTSMQLASGASAEITITPTADSSSVNDVHIIATAEDGTQLAEDDMTVVMVTVPNVISNADTPAAMLAAGAYRIPPRVSTPETIQVTPSLSGSGQSVTLIVADQSATNGTVTIGGNASQAVTSSGSIQLSSQSGNTQTAPGNAAQLHLALQVRGQNTIQSSRGFSVAAIPQYVEDVLQASLTGTVRGIQVANVWKSDSGVLGDLNDVTIQEQVRSVSASGIFSGRPFVTSGPLAATLTSPSYPNLGISIDTHSFPISWITNQVYTGTRVAAQTSDFVDRRSGPAGPITVPMANSGDNITQTVFAVTTKVGRKRVTTLMVKTTEVGAATTANGIASGPVTTYQPPATTPRAISVTQSAGGIPGPPSPKKQRGATS